MPSFYTKASHLRRLGLTALLAGGTALAAQAQFTYFPNSSSTNAGTYTDLGTAGLAIATANNDDANSTAQDIGFTFPFNGTIFTQFVLNTNGLLRLGASAPAAALAASPYAQTPELGPINSTAPADVNLLLPFNFDLGPGTGTPEFRVATTGTAGSRVCTIQWKNMADKAVATDAATPATISTQYTNLSFQVKLYEGSNQVEFVYDAPTVGATTALKYAVVGVKGSSSGASIIASKASPNAWNTTTFGNGPQPTASTNAHNFRATFPPDAGRTYRFIPTQPNDAAIAIIYTLGKLSRTLNASHQVRAMVTNRGFNALTNVVVTLNVTGANTFTNTQTIATLAPNASTTVTLAAYPATLALGTNNVVVSVPADDNSANNSATYTQQITNDQVLIADPALGTVGALNYSNTTTGGALAAKFTVSGTNNQLTNAVFYFGPSSMANTDYQAVVYSANTAGTAPGTVLFTSPTQARPKAGGAVTVPLNNTVVPGTYFIGIKEIGFGGAGLGTQPESPLRPGTFAVSADGTTWTDFATSTLQVRLMIESNLAVTLTATSPALLRSLSVYPNPSASGIFMLAVKGAYAGAAGLGVEVTNQLGQRVYTGSAQDNFASQLNLSTLAPGIYHLTIRNGNEYATTKLTISL